MRVGAVFRAALTEAGDVVHIHPRIGQPGPLHGEGAAGRGQGGVGGELAGDLRSQQLLPAGRLTAGGARSGGCGQHKPEGREGLGAAHGGSLGHAGGGGVLWCRFGGGFEPNWHQVHVKWSFLAIKNVATAAQLRCGASLNSPRRK